MASNEFQIGLGDKLMVIPAVARILFSATARFVTRPFVGGPRANAPLKDVAFAGVRTMLSVTSTETEQFMNAPTESVYKDIMKKESLKIEIETIDDKLELLWIGSKTAEKVLLYCHGGGYAVPASPAHLMWLVALYKDLSKNHDFSIAVIRYTLSPYGKYPLQLQQAADSLQWLLQKGEKKPGNIFVGGDSAGGNMTITLLAHLLHPHPDVTTKIQLSEPLAGAILISPWIKFATDYDSIKRNANSDMITVEAARRWSALFLGGKPLDNYNQPFLADVSWLKGLESYVKDILMWGGGAEVLIDSINDFSKKLKEAYPKLEYVVQPGASHDDFILERLFGYTEKAEGTQLIESWLSTRM